MQLGIGTAQFGIDYGISNPKGKVLPEEVVQILNEARKLGITLLDTAYAYGDSETVLGLSLSAGHVLNIVTKLPPLNKEHITAEDATYMESCFQESLSRLHKKRSMGFCSITQTMFWPVGNCGLFRVG